MSSIATVISNSNKNDNALDTIYTIKKAGFKNVFIQWYNADFNPSQEEQLNYIKELGLNVIFAHLEYKNIDNIWKNKKEGEKLVNLYKENIKKCKENNIPMVIMHLCGREKEVNYNEIGLKRLQKIVDYAEKLNIKIAFENTTKKGYLEYVIDNIKNKNIGVCYDSGHDHTHFNNDFNFEKFKDKIIAVHLHDNVRLGDDHLMPFDGTIDWNYVMKKLKEANYKGPITLEICYYGYYLNMTLTEFYIKGYEIGNKLKDIFDKIK